MPVDLSKPQSVRRDAAPGLRQDGMFSREIEMKRSRGEISCAECRRLKIKCDKQIPCQSCQDFPVVLILAWILAFRGEDVSHYVQMVIFPQGKKLGSRSSDPHPLLCEGSLLVDTDKLDEQPQESEDEGVDEVTKSLGTLTVSDHGLSRFFGSTGGSDLLLRFSHSFPFTPPGTVKQNINTIKDCLPTWDHALAMAESYLANATWLFRSVTRQQLIDEMLPAIYGKRTAYADDCSGPHDLALLFGVFALGSVMDVSLPNSTAESEGNHYHQLTLAALCQQPVLVKPSVVTIQTLHISAVYIAMLGGDVSGGESTLESTWSLVAVACYLAQTCSLATLDRDPARWESDPRIVQRRRLVFWNLFFANSWHALVTGRPPSFNRAFIDCKFPQEDVPANLDPGDSSLRPAEIVACTLTASPPRYSTIQELDLKIQEFRVPHETIQAIRGGPGVDPRSVPIPASMTAFLLSIMQDVFLLYLHRNFFIQALIEDPEDPSRGQYAPSFLATVRASKNILRTVEEQFLIQPVILSRFWMTMDVHVLCRRAYSLIEVASQTNRGAKRALAILNRMREKAHLALATEEIEDDFVVYAGRGRVFLPGGNMTAAPQAVPTPPHDESSPLAMTHTYVTAIEPLPSGPHDQHQRHQHQHQQRQYGYTPEQPQYTIEAVPSHYMTAPYASYAPPPHPPHQLLHPHNLHPSPHTPGMGRPSHGLHADELADMRRDHAVMACAPPAELAQLGFAANGSRLSETWVSFMQ
ncbi:hypothetical protein EDB83DRAFT_2318365 [Lactarius deliciosus]|nr:hypothetical protein EDB83DRAFT_2318365 [Lactarius deliciosus]